MKTLQSLFEDTRTEFKKKIESAADPKFAAAEIENLLEALERAFLDQLAVHVARLAGMLFSELRVMPEALAIVKQVETAQPSPPVVETGKSAVPTVSPWSRALFKAVQICLAVQVFVVAEKPAGHGHSLLILLLTALLIADLFMDVWVAFSQKQLRPLVRGSAIQLGTTPRLTEAAPAFLPSRLNIDANALCSTLSKAFGVVDDATSILSQLLAQERTQTGLTDFHEIVTFFQALISAGVWDSAPRALNLAKEAKGLLLVQGIKAQVFRAGENDQVFDFEPAVVPDIKECTTDLVALRTDKGLLRRGRVLEPYVSK